MRLLLPLLGLILIAMNAGPAYCTETPRFTLILKNHQFIPSEIQVPANQKIELRITNTDSTPEEFESLDLHREKVVTGNQEITVYVGPLQPGAYEFFGDFNPKMARGRLIAR